MAQPQMYDTAGFNKPFGKQNSSGSSSQLQSQTRVLAAKRNVDQNAILLQQQQALGQTPRRLDVLTNNNSVLKESSMLFMSKLLFKPFNYGKCNEKLNLKLLENTRVDEIEYSGDLQRAQTLLRNSAFTNFDVELIEKMGYDNFNKLFRLWQLAILNYGSRQREEQAEGERKYTKYRELLEASQKIDELKKAHAEKRTKLYEILKTLQWQVNELKAASNSRAKFKCTYCDKNFGSQQATTSHINEVHKQQLSQIKHDKEVLDNLGNPTQVLTKREERKIKEANDLIAQRVTKEIESKMGEQLRKLAEAQEELQRKQLLQSQIRQRNEEQRAQGLTFKSEIDQEDQGKKKELANSIMKMNNAFGGFEEMFAQMQIKQQSLLEEQELHKRRLQEIEAEQKKQESEAYRGQYSQNGILQSNNQLDNIHSQMNLAVSRRDIDNDDRHQRNNSNSGQRDSLSNINFFAAAKEPSFGQNAQGNSNANNDGNIGNEIYISNEISSSIPYKQAEPSGSKLNRASSRKWEGQQLQLEEVEEETKRDMRTRGVSRISQYQRSPQSQGIMMTGQSAFQTQFSGYQLASHTNPGGAYGGLSDPSSTRKSDLKRQFLEKYDTEDNLVKEEKNKQNRLQHIGDMESDVDSDLMDDYYGNEEDEKIEDEEDYEDEDYQQKRQQHKKRLRDRDILIPTNQNQMLKDAELELKKKLMTEKEISDIQKNIQYKMELVRREAKAQDGQGKKGKQKGKILIENDKMMANFAPAEVEKRKNEKLIDDVLEMNDRQMDRDEDEAEFYQFVEQRNMPADLDNQQLDVAKMKKQFIKDNLGFDFEEDTDILDLEDDEFYKLQKSFQNKYQPKKIPSDKP